MIIIYNVLLYNTIIKEKEDIIMINNMNNNNY